MSRNWVTEQEYRHIWWLYAGKNLRSSKIWIYYKFDDENGHWKI